MCRAAQSSCSSSYHPPLPNKRNHPPTLTHYTTTHTTSTITATLKSHAFRTSFRSCAASQFKPFVNVSSAVYFLSRCDPSLPSRTLNYVESFCSRTFVSCGRPLLLPLIPHAAKQTSAMAFLLACPPCVCCNLLLCASFSLLNVLLLVPRHERIDEEAEWGVVWLVCDLLLPSSSSCSHASNRHTSSCLLCSCPAPLLCLA